MQLTNISPLLEAAKSKHKKAEVDGRIRMILLKKKIEYADFPNRKIVEFLQS